MAISNFTEGLSRGQSNPAHHGIYLLHLEPLLHLSAMRQLVVSWINASCPEQDSSVAKGSTRMKPSAISA